MYKTIHKVDKILKTFNAIPSGFKNPKAKKYKLRGFTEPPGAGNIVAHHQGVDTLDGNANFIITGSAIGHPGYFHLVKNGKGYDFPNGTNYFETDIAYTHPGGIQIAEDIFAIGNEQYNGATTYTDRSIIKFYDISNEDKIFELDHLRIQRDQTTGYNNSPIASAIGLTKNNGQWLMAVRSKETLDFYGLTGDIKDNASSFTLIGSLNKTKFHLNDYQSIYLYFSTQGKLYLFGMPRKTENDDKCFLHLIKTKLIKSRIKSVIGARTLKIRHFKRNGSGPRFKYASCIEFLHNKQSGKLGVGKFRIHSIEADVNDHEIRCNYWSAS